MENVNECDGNNFFKGAKNGYWGNQPGTPKILDNVINQGNGQDVRGQLQHIAPSHTCRKDYANPSESGEAGHTAGSSRGIYQQMLSKRRIDGKFMEGLNMNAITTDEAYKTGKTHFLRLFAEKADIDLLCNLDASGKAGDVAHPYISFADVYPEALRPHAISGFFDAVKEVGEILLSALSPHGTIQHT